MISDDFYRSDVAYRSVFATLQYTVSFLHEARPAHIDRTHSYRIISLLRSCGSSVLSRKQSVIDAPLRHDRGLTGGEFS